MVAGKFAWAGCVVLLFPVLTAVPLSAQPSVCWSLAPLFAQGATNEQVAMGTGLPLPLVARCRAELSRSAPQPFLVPGPAGAPPIGAAGPPPVHAPGPPPVGAVGPPPFPRR